MQCIAACFQCTQTLQHTKYSKYTRVSHNIVQCCLKKSWPKVIESFSQSTWQYDMFFVPKTYFFLAVSLFTVQPSAAKISGKYLIFGEIPCRIVLHLWWLKGSIVQGLSVLHGVYIWYICLRNLRQFHCKFILMKHLTFRIHSNLYIIFCC